MDKLNETRALPLYTKGQDIEKYLKELVKDVERLVYADITKRMNFILDRVSDSAYWIVNDDGDLEAYFIIDGTLTASGFIITKPS